MSSSVMLVSRSVSRASRLAGIAVVMNQNAGSREAFAEPSPEPPWQGSAPRRDSVAGASGRMQTAARARCEREASASDPRRFRGRLQPRSTLSDRGPGGDSLGGEIASPELRRKGSLGIGPVENLHFAARKSTIPGLRRRGAADYASRRSSIAPWARPVVSRLRLIACRSQPFLSSLPHTSSTPSVPASVPVGGGLAMGEEESPLALCRLVGSR